MVSNEYVFENISFEIEHNPRGKNGEMGNVECETCGKKSTVYLIINDGISLIVTCKACLTRGIQMIDNFILNTDDNKERIASYDDDIMKSEYDFSCGKRKAIQPKMGLKPPVRRIIRNAIKCGECGEVVESIFRHDFKWCKCESVFVDGGFDYLRRGGKGVDKSTDLSEYEKLQ